MPIKRKAPAVRLAEHILEAMWSTHRPDPTFPDAHPHIDSKFGLREITVDGHFDMIAVAEVVWAKLLADDLEDSKSLEDRIERLEKAMASVMPSGTFAGAHPEIRPGKAA